MHFKRVGHESDICCLLPIHEQKEFSHFLLQIFQALLRLTKKQITLGNHDLIIHQFFLISMYIILLKELNKLYMNIRLQESSSCQKIPNFPGGLSGHLLGIFLSCSRAFPQNSEFEKIYAFEDQQAGWVVHKDGLLFRGLVQ